MVNNLPENERALWILKNKGPQPLNVLATEMNVTTEGARFQLLKLSNDGLVQSRTESKGRGRPQQIWSLTALGHGRFPDTHGELMVRMIRTMRETLGEKAFAAVIEANGREGLERYTRELEPLTSLEDRVRGLAGIRDREGYMAAYTQDSEGFLLMENHCPICAAATACQGFCKSELNTFQQLLGDDVEVKRIDHILAGARRCAYRITPVD